MAFVIALDAFDPDGATGFDDVFGAFDPEVGQLRNVDESFLARQNFDKGAELFGGNNATLIGRADFNFLRHPADDFLRARHRFATGRVDVDRAVIFDVNLGAGFSHDPLDRFAARSDERAASLGLNFDRLDPWSVVGPLRRRFLTRVAHDLK